MESILQVKNVCKNHGKSKILKDISFDIETGDIVGLIGQNGAGKTTLIDILSGVNSLDSGEVLLHSKWTNKNCEEYYNHLCVAFDQASFYGDLTGLRNLKMYSEDNGKIEYLLRKCQLYNVKDKKVTTYSYGMRQRLNLVRAFLMWKDLIIMDEPLNGLDPSSVLDIKHIISNKCGEGLSALVSSHALKELLFFCNKFIFIHKGQIVAQIDSKRDEDFELYDSYANSEDKLLKQFLKERGLPFLEIDSLKTIYFTYNADIPQNIVFNTIEKESNILENIYFRIENIGE